MRTRKLVNSIISSAEGTTYILDAIIDQRLDDGINSTLVLEYYYKSIRRELKIDVPMFVFEEKRVGDRVKIKVEL